MAKYFINFDYYNREINRFMFTIVDFDIDKIEVYDVVKNTIKEKDPSMDLDSLTINIKSFNRV